jgi:hypothetical protein
MNNVIESRTDNVPFAAPGGDERWAFFLLVGTENAKKIETAAQEEAAIGAQAILTKADEALVLG